MIGNSNFGFESGGSDLTGYVPYIGATQNLNLGSNNLFVNNVFSGFTSVAASATLITLTVNSTPYYLVTGSGGQTIKLPNATTLSKGAIYYFNNNQSSGAILVNNNSNTLVKSVPSGGSVIIELIDNSIAAGSWDSHSQAPSNVSWSTNTFSYAGSFTGGTWNGSAIGILYGGTGATTAAGARTNLGSTTVGDNFFTLTNPSAITFPQINANNTVSALSASDFRTAIGASGIITLSAIGSSPNANAATLTSTVLNLEPASASFGGVVTTGIQTFAGVKTFSGNTLLSTSGVTRVANSTIAWQGGAYTPTFAVFGTTTARALIHASDNTAGTVGSLTTASIFSGTSGNFGNIFAANNSYTVNTGTNPTIATGVAYSYFNQGNGGYYNYLNFTGTGTNTRTFNGLGNYFYYQSSGGALNMTGSLFGIRSMVQLSDNALSGITLTSLSDILLESVSVTVGTGTITNRYGLNISFTAANTTNSWGVYQSDSGVKNFFNGSVGFGTNSINANAVADFTSTTKGVLFPRMTTIQKNAITTPSGLVIYDTDLGKLCVRGAINWETITSV